METETENLAAALTLLQDARATLADPGHWTQLETARTAAGFPCRTTSPNAHKFCVLGALDHAWIARGFGTAPFTVAQAFLAAAVDLQWDIAHAWNFVTNKVTGFNDQPERTHAEILQLIDDAAATLKTNHGL